MTGPLAGCRAVPGIRARPLRRRQLDFLGRDHRRKILGGRLCHPCCSRRTADDIPAEPVAGVAAIDIN
jgi:hypothetical protein